MSYKFECLGCRILLVFAFVPMLSSVTWWKLQLQSPKSCDFPLLPSFFIFHILLIENSTRIFLSMEFFMESAPSTRMAALHCYWPFSIHMAALNHCAAVLQQQGGKAKWNCAIHLFKAVGLVHLPEQKPELSDVTRSCLMGIFITSLNLFSGCLVLCSSPSAWFLFCAYHKYSRLGHL